MVQRNALGTYGEALAKQYLEQHGYTILHQNWRSGRSGEIDIVALLPPKHLLAFVEVKTRRSTRYGSPLEAVSLTKQTTIRTLAESYITLYGAELPYSHISFDIIAVSFPGGKDSDAVVEHIPEAF